MTRAIRELVETEVIYFISTLVDELLKQEKYHLAFSLLNLLVGERPRLTDTPLYLVFFN